VATFKFGLLKVGPMLALREWTDFEACALPEVLLTMSDEDALTEVLFKVVVNDEEQYSIWPAERANPLGWRDAGKSGNKKDCLDFIESVWADMRPLSLRK